MSLILVLNLIMHMQTDRNKLERLFEQQQQGAIVKASREQIEALSGREEGGQWPFGREEGGRWPFGRSRSFNLFNKRPFHANQHGQLYIADREDLRELEDMDVMISFANITQARIAFVHFSVNLLIGLNSLTSFLRDCIFLISLVSNYRT